MDNRQLPYKTIVLYTGTMANSWQADEEDDEFILKEPTFRPQEPSQRPVPELPPAWRRQVGLILMTTGIFVFTLALGELVQRGIAKWLD